MNKGGDIVCQGQAKRGNDVNNSMYGMATKTKFGAEYACVPTCSTNAKRDWSCRCV